MTTIETTYDIGDVVFGVQFLTARRRPPCTLCDGSGRVQLAAIDRTITCPDCYGLRYDQADDHVAVQERATISRLTIGSVAWNSTDGASYMAEETGVGSGTRWSQDKLYGSFDVALSVCSDAVVVFGYLSPGNPGVQNVIRGTAADIEWEPFS